jgi:hypothetical protein
MDAVFDMDLDVARLPPDDKINWIAMNRFQFMALQINVTTTEGKEIVRRHRHTCDARRVMYELRIHHTKSTTAVITRQRLRQYLTTARLDNSWRDTCVEFITQWCETAETYNDQAPSDGGKFSDEMLKDLLQAAVQSISPLREIKNQEHVRILTGMPPLSFHDYKVLLLSSARTHDEMRLARSRSAYVLDTEPSSDPYDMDALAGLIVNKMEQKERPRLPDDKFKLLSGEQKREWASLSDDLRKILISGAPNKQRSVHFAAADTSDDKDSPSDTQDTAETDPEDAFNQAISPDLDVNAAQSKRKPRPKKLAEAHPADPRRALSPQNKVVTSYNVMHNPPDLLSGDAFADVLPERRASFGGSNPNGDPFSIFQAQHNKDMRLVPPPFDPPTSAQGNGRSPYQVQATTIRDFQYDSDSDSDDGCVSFKDFHYGG